YAQKILNLQPKLTLISQALLDIPILTTLSELDHAFTSSFEEYLTTSNRYRIVLYVLVFVLLIVLRSSFARLTSTVAMLHVEVQRKIRAEKELEEINRQLEQRVADRTKELTNKNKDLNNALSDLEEAQEQLIIQEKMASVGMLTTGVAHEIKNPLNFINNFSDISVDLVDELNEELETLNGKVDKETLNFIKEITGDLKINCQKVKEHGDRADNIVKNMLLHSQESSTTKEMVDISTVMDSSIRASLDKYSIDNKNQEILFKKKYTPDLQKVLCAPQAIARVILYILDNSLYSVLEKKKQKQQPDYQPSISITLDNMQDKIYIKIHDNGLGISKAEIDKVFEPFFTSKPTGMGNTGLGLSICYDIIVKQHKGELKAQSEESLFAEFIIILPVNVHELTYDPET
ncbi:MAG: signal transduction histidine kinase, partial [Enterobacterales bacterium]